ncbi:histone H3.3 [Amphibalanus amphitrite]|uniref:Histone H3.3 n=1 Tax=Amphibalanus amphitrite TaxID=1232801 RepID=A0A6A4XAT5_AMPAM|nr:histone H3.3 [Amphibalanus amphitrite]
MWSRSSCTKLPFRPLVCGTAQDLTTDLRIRCEPVPALQRASEAYLAGLPGDISLCAVHGLPGDISLCAVKSNRVAATPNDIQQAYH